MFPHRIAIPFVTAALWGASSLRAAPMYFFGSSSAGTFASARSAFQAAAGGGLQFEGFNTAFSTQPLVAFPIGGPRAFTLDEDSSSEFIVSTKNRSMVTEGLRGVEASSNNPSKYTFTFDEAIQAFGIDIPNHNVADTQITFQDDLGNQYVLPEVPSPGVDMFFGVINELPFSRVRFETMNHHYKPTRFTGFLGFDHLEYGAVQLDPGVVTPEPSSLVTWLLVCVTAGGAAWKCRCSI